MLNATQQNQTKWNMAQLEFDRRVGIWSENVTGTLMELKK